MKLELVPIPVADVDRAKAFYAEQLGFVVDVDVSPVDGVRVVQLTPPGSACSIGFGTGIPVYDAPPGRQALCRAPSTSRSSPCRCPR
jgi:catechol 2,3-dioxygenase-like lactoylglutathione lyase family enzyme